MFFFKFSVADITVRLFFQVVVQKIIDGLSKNYSDACESMQFRMRHFLLDLLSVSDAQLHNIM